MRIHELQSQAQTQTYTHGETFHFPSAQSVYSDQIIFYKEKNQELEERVDSHIKVNRDLRESIERLLKGHNDEYSIVYYKEQLTIVNELYIVLQGKHKKLQKENQRLKDEMGKVNSRPMENHAELEIRIVELNRRISQLVIEINQLEQDKAGSGEKVDSFEKHILRLKIEIDELIESRQETIRGGRERERTLEEEISRLTSKLRMQSLEIDQMNEAINKR